MPDCQTATGRLSLGGRILTHCTTSIFKIYLYYRAVITVNR